MYFATRYKSKILTYCFILYFSFSYNLGVYAADVELTGETTVNTLAHACAIGQKNCHKKILKKITLQTVKLDPNFKKDLRKKLNLVVLSPKSNPYLSDVKLNNQILKTQVDLGMANVPVLDQGAHGTCVTFATTAALDALKKAGDMISQQCLLEVGSTEEDMSNGEIPSGWNGAFYEDVLDRIHRYGIVEKSRCPHQYANRYEKMYPNEYLSFSKSRKWANAFNTKQLHSITPSEHLIPATVRQVKEALNNNHRVLASALLLYEHAGGLPMEDLPNGLWDFPIDYTQEQFDKDIKEERLGGHAFIIIGYDDELQMFKIRNSWGPNVGDKGDFYMTYTYFKVMNIDAFEIY